MKLINFEKLDNSGYFTPTLENGSRRVTFTKSPFSFWLLGQESYKLLGYWEIIKDPDYSYDPHMNNIWLNCDDGIAYWDNTTKTLEGLELSTASDMKFKNTNGQTGYNVFYRIKTNTSGFERPIITESGGEAVRGLMAYLRDHAQGQPMSFVRLELAQWGRYRPKVLDTSNNSLEYVNQTSETGLYQIPWAIPAGLGKTAFLKIGYNGSQFGRDTAIAYGEDKEIAAYWANRANDNNKIGRITPAFTGYGPSYFVAHADPSAAFYMIRLDDLYHKLVKNLPSDDEEDFSDTDRYIAA